MAPSGGMVATRPREPALPASDGVSVAPGRRLPSPVVGLAALACVAWVVLLALRYRRFAFVDWDLAIFAQMLWNLAHGSGESSLLHVHLLGNHANFLAYALAPVYRLLPHPVALLALKAVCCTFAIVPLHRLARARCGEPVATALAVAFLLYAPLTHVLAGEFDYETLAPVLLLWLWVGFLEDRRALFVAVMVPALLLKENQPLLVASFGVAGMLVRPGKRWWAGVTAVALAFFAATVFAIVPAARGATASVYWTLYAPLGSSPREILATVVLHPLRTVGLLLSPESLRWLWQLFVPLGPFALLGVDAVLVALPVFMQDMLSSNIGARTIYYHYVATVTPFVFVAAVLGIARLLRLLPHARWPRATIAGVVLVCAAGTQALWGPWGVATPAAYRFPSLRADALDGVRRDLVRAIPPDAGVVASFRFLPALSGRRRLYAIHDAYLDRLRSGDQRPYALPADAEYALLDLDDPQLVAASRRSADVTRNLAMFYLRHPWTVVRTVESLVLLRKGSDSSPKLVESVAALPLDESTAWAFEGGLQLVAAADADLGRGAPGAVVPVRLAWQATAVQRTTYAVAFRWVRDGRVVRESSHPVGYRMFPAWTWRPDRRVVEHVFLLAPSEPGWYRLEARVVDELTRATLAARGVDREPATDVPLGTFVVADGPA